MKKTSTVLMLALALIAAALCGCGKKEEKTPAPNANATAAAPKTLVFAVDATYPPMQYLNEKGEVEGFEIDVIRTAADKAGFRAEFRSLPWEGVFERLEKKEFDGVAASLSITEERKATLDFSDPIIAIEQVLLVPKDSKVTDMASLKGKSAGTQAGNISHKLLLADKGLKAAKGYPDQAAAVEDMLRGGLQAVLTGRPRASGFVAQHPDKLKIAGAVASYDVGVAFRKGDRQSVELVNKGLAAAKADGTIERLKEKYQLK